MYKRQQSRNSKGSSKPVFKLSESFDVDRLNQGYDDRFEHIFNDLVQVVLDYYASNIEPEQVMFRQAIILSEDRYRQILADAIKKLHKGNRKQGETPHRMFMERVKNAAREEMAKKGYEVRHVPEKFIKITFVGKDDLDVKTEPLPEHMPEPVDLEYDDDFLHQKGSDESDHKKDIVTAMNSLKKTGTDLTK